MRYPLIAEAVHALPVPSCVIDGEAVALDSNGLPSFDRLRFRRDDDRVVLFAFDLLQLDGTDLRREALEQQGSARPLSLFPLRSHRGRRSTCLGVIFAVLCSTSSANVPTFARCRLGWIASGKFARDPPSAGIRRQALETRLRRSSQTPEER